MRSSFPWWCLIPVIISGICPHGDIAGSCTANQTKCLTLSASVLLRKFHVAWAPKCYPLHALCYLGNQQIASRAGTASMAWRTSRRPCVALLAAESAVVPTAPSSMRRTSALPTAAFPSEFKGHRRDVTGVIGLAVLHPVSISVLGREMHNPTKSNHSAISFKIFRKPAATETHTNNMTLPPLSLHD